MNHFYQNIDGWFDFEQIYNHAIDTAHENDILIETGTWFGKSAAYLGVEAVNRKKKLRIFTIDVNHEYRDIQNGMVDRNEKIKVNLRRLQNVTYLNEDSIEASKKFDDGSCFMVFLDALHTYEFLHDELRAWFPKVAKGGIFAGHDIISFESVQRAVNEFCREKGLQYEIINNSWMIKL